MWSQLYGVCYCLSNSCAIVLRHNRRFDYRPQFQDRQKPHPLISRRAVWWQHYRPIIKYQKTARSVVGVEPITFRTAATDNDKTSASTVKKRPPRPMIILGRIITNNIMQNGPTRIVFILLTCIITQIVTSLFYFALIYNIRNVPLSKI